MINLKIRFIEQGGKYSLQRWKLFRWKWALIQSGASMEGPNYEVVKDKSKDRCLNKYLHYLGECKEYINVTEYPSIKKY